MYAPRLWVDFLGCTIALVWTIGKKYLTMVVAAQTDWRHPMRGTDQWHMAVGKALTRLASQPP